MEITLEAMLLASMNTGRPLMPSEFFERFEEEQKRRGRLVTWGAMEAGIKRLMRDGMVKVVNRGIVKVA